MGAVALGIDLVLLILSPLLALGFLIASRGLTRPKLRRGILEKIGGFPRREGDSPAVWVHAVSVGEVLIAEPLVRTLRERFPEADVVLSVSTFTGREVARQRLPDVTTFYAPLDAGVVVGTALRRVRPDVIILVELEVWPSFLVAARRRGVPVYVVNGRITERSTRGYLRFGFLSRALFRLVTAYAVQNEEYSDRLGRVGVPSERRVVLGNIKYDREPAPGVARAPEVRRGLGWSIDRVIVLVAGCTHPGEEAAIAEAYGRLRGRFPSLRLVLAPRHVERLGDDGEIARWGVSGSVVRWSAWRAARLAANDSDEPSDREAPDVAEGPSPDARSSDASSSASPDALVVDTVGDLEMFYALADVVFVGGSLVDRGGHNVLEPARLARPIVVGPHVDNFVDEVSLLRRHDGIRIGASRAEVEGAIVSLLDAPSRRDELGTNARHACELLQGALARHADWLSGQFRLFLHG